jgi:7,8-dihydroneopterin aldolase/epimerase/oxygenase
MDTIFIRELRLSAWVGVNPHEKMAPQTIELNIELGVPGDAVFRSGRVRDTIDYGAVAQRVRVLLADEKFGLVERLADRVAHIILDEFGAPWAKVSVAKFGAVKEARSVGAMVERRR